MTTMLTETLLVDDALDASGAEDASLLALLAPAEGDFQLVLPEGAKRRADDEEEEVEEEVEDVAAPEIVSLEDADAEEAGDEEIPDVEDVEVDEELADDEADVFLEEDEDEDDELGFDVGGDEDR